MSTETPAEELYCTVERRYEVLLRPGTRTVWGESLAEALIDEALRLLCADFRQDVDAAYERLCQLASENAHLLFLERQAGQKPGLVLKAPRRHDGMSSR